MTTHQIAFDNQAY